MAISSNINEILSQVKQLDKEDQLTLLQRVAYLMKRRETDQNTETRITMLSGLGSEIWKNMDEIDNYIEEERQW